MTKLSRLVDFQVYARPSGLAEREQKPLNESLFSTYEPVRLWLRDRVIQARFKKTAISLADEVSSAMWHGNVSNAIGICQVTEAVNVPSLRSNVGDARWVLGIVGHALASVAQSVGWRSDELELFIAGTIERAWPLVHFFERLTQVEKVSGWKCVAWLSTRPGETQVGLRLGERDVTILSKPGPLYFEDDFPVAKSAITAREYVLLDKAGKSLAGVVIDNSTLQ